MGRKNLNWYPGALYHITSRGNHRSCIFGDREDYKVYLKILKEALGKHSCILICYCLMTNHVHLIVKTSDIHVSELMRRVNLFYTKYFNNKNNLAGHLFQGRYKAELIADRKYLLEASRYVHLNPVRAKIVENPEGYEWSSYPVFIGLNDEKLVNASPVLFYFSDIDKENGMGSYRQFVELGTRYRPNFVSGGRNKNPGQRLVVE